MVPALGRPAAEPLRNGAYPSKSCFLITRHPTITVTLRDPRCCHDFFLKLMKTRALVTYEI
eukprot:scaffold12338_cov119-Isochrysis_galbana.AAC.3